MTDNERIELDRLIFQMVAKANVGPGEDYSKKAFELIQMQSKEYEHLLVSSVQRLIIALILKAYNITRAEYDVLYSQFIEMTDWIRDADIGSYELLNKIIEIYKLGYSKL